MNLVSREKAIDVAIDEYNRGYKEGFEAGKASVSGGGDLISRQAVLDAIDVQAWEFCDYLISKGRNDEQKPVSHFADNLREYIGTDLPSAEPEIIRCKDCKHRPLDGEDTQGSGIEFPDEICPCQCEDFWYSWRPDDDWFCAYAERRTDGAD